jgi:prepilin-type N-terminal cleavage/methylation domain-containing protein
VRSGFTILEVLLALAIAALVMAALGPALIGSLRAERQARATLGPLVEEPAALSQLREDLLCAPRPLGSLTVPCTLATTQVAGRRGDTFTIFTAGPPPLHPNIALRSPEVGQAVVTWAVQASADGKGLAWTRSRKVDLLATGITADPVAEVMLDHLASLAIEACSGGSFITSYDSSNLGDVLPSAVRITWSRLETDGSNGPNHVAVIDLPQVALDPTQNGSDG